MNRCCVFLTMVWLAGVNAFGIHLTETNWTVNPDEPGTSWATWSTVLKNGDLLAVGYEDTNGTARPRVMRIDTNGIVQFSHAFSTSLMTNYSIRAIYAGLLSNSNVFVGCTASDNGAPGAFFMTLTPDGSSMITQALVSASPLRFSHNSSDEVLAVGAAGVSLYTLNGSFINNGSLADTGAPVGNSINQTADGGYIAAGKIGNAAFLTRLDSNLSNVWSQQYYDTNGSQTAYCAVENPDGTFTACGLEGNGDSSDQLLLFKTTAGGTRLWAHKERGGQYGGFNTVVATSSNEAIVVGASYQHPHIACYGANGELLWSKTGEELGILRGIIAVTTNRYSATGWNHSAGSDNWLTFSLTETYNAEIIVNDVFPFEPNESNGWTVATITGVTNSFAFDGYDPESGNLQCNWVLAGKLVSTNSAYSFVATPETAGSMQTMMLMVTDGANWLEYNWNIDISNRATVVSQILPFEPVAENSNVTVRVGYTAQFVINGYDPDGNELQHRWLLNGSEVSTTNSYNFTPSMALADSTNTLSLQVAVIPGVEATNYTWQITVPAIYAPNQAVPLSPWSGETGVSAGKAPTLSWIFSEDAEHPVNWSAIYFSANQHSVTYRFPDAEVLNDGVTFATNYNASGILQYETTYYWCIVAHNAAGESASPVFSFTTGALPQPPYAPYANRPWVGSTGVRIDVNPTVEWGFSWDASHPVDRSELYFSTNFNAVSVLSVSEKVVSNGSAPDGRYTASEALQLGQTYYWRVVGHNSVGSSTGEVWTFTTESLRSPPYEENFETPPLPPSGWRNLMNQAGDGGLDGNNLQQDWSGWNSVFDVNLVRSGKGAIGLNGGMPAYHWLESPLFQPVVGTEMRCWLYYGPNGETPSAPLHLLVKVDGVWQVVRSWSPAQTNRYESEVVVPLTTYAGKTVRLAWVYNFSSFGAPVALDDFRMLNDVEPPVTNYTLTVNSGTGGGAYPEHSTVSIAASAATAGKRFSVWVGNTQYVESVTSAFTTVTMPASNVTVTATYVVKDTDGDGMDDDWEITLFHSVKPDGSGDEDKDGMTNLDEFIANTDPCNSNSIFRVAGFERGAQSIIRWSACAGRVYSVYWRTNLLSEFQSVSTNILWSQPVFTNNSAQSSGYYKISVRMAE